MVEIPAKVQQRFKKMADNLFSLRFINSAEADNAKFQYDQFITKDVLINKEKFLKFNFKFDRLDSFLYQFVGLNTDYSDLWNVMKLIFIASHGQSFTERGFSVNKLTTDVNMEAESLIAQRVIYDAISSADANVATFPISKELKQSCKKARQREKVAREGKKKRRFTKIRA